MLQKQEKAPTLPKETLKAELKKQRERLVKQQILIRGKLPVLVLVEGWGAAGKGGLIGKLIGELDPRFFKVVPARPKTEEEQRRPFLWKHFNFIPEAGKFLFLDSGWMEELVEARMNDEVGQKEYDARIESFRIFERQLAAGGYLLVKIFVNIDKKEQEKRLKKLLDEKDTAWRVSEKDQTQNENFEKYRVVYDEVMTKTDAPGARWHVIDGTHRKEAELAGYTLLADLIDAALKNQSEKVATPKTAFPLIKMPLLADVQLDCEISQNEYKEQLDNLQERLRELHNRLYRMRVPVIVCYEGWDAAGKGGNIKRLTHALDPRGFEVLPIASPEPHELARHYLWRFWTRLPKTGHITLFDRTWYGRVMVERIEGFCKPADWKRAYTEINEFEKELTDWGAVVIKFWIQIDKETQLRRFTDRQNTPEKQWKITEEDWRNREKWDEYETAVNEMLQKTSTQNAPWHIIESVDKKFARIKALRLLIEAIEKAL